MTIGVVTLLWPAPSIRTVAWLIGAHLIVAGIVVVAAESRVPGPPWVARVVLGVLVAVAGVAVLARPVTPISTLAMVCGMAFATSGVGYIVAAATWPLRFPGAAWIKWSGAVSVVVGLAILGWRDITVGRLALLSGLLLAGSGVLVTVGRWRVRNLAKRLQERSRVQSAVLGFEIQSDRQGSERSHVIDTGRVDRR